MAHSTSAMRDRHVSVAMVSLDRECVLLGWDVHQDTDKDIWCKKTARTHTLENLVNKKKVTCVASAPSEYANGALLLRMALRNPTSLERLRTGREVAGVVYGDVASDDLTRLVDESRDLKFSYYVRNRRGRCMSRKTFYIDKHPPKKEIRYLDRVYQWLNAVLPAAVAPLFANINSG